VQFSTNFTKGGGLPWFSQSGEVCFKNQNSEQCVAFFRAWLRGQLTTFPIGAHSMAGRMFNFYGQDLKLPQQWIFTERLVSTTLDVLSKVTAGQLSSNAAACFSKLNSTKEKVSPITRAAIKPRNTSLYYDAALLELVAKADRIIFERFNYTLCATCDQFPRDMTQHTAFVA